MVSIKQMRAHERHYVTKLVFRCLNIVFCLATAAMIGRLNDMSKILSDFNFAQAVGIWFLFPVLLALVWSATSVGVQLVRKRPCHPGFAVGFDLILWFGLATAAGFMTPSSWMALLSSEYWINTVNDNSNMWAPYYAYWNFGYDGPITPNKAPGFSGWATSAILTAIRDQNDYTYRATNGVTSTRSYGSIDYRCPNWDSCAQRQSAYNDVHYTLVFAVAVSIMLCIDAILEIILFIWACVDCKAFNRRRADDADIEARAHKLAQQMVAEQEEILRLEKERAVQTTPAYDFVATEK